MENNLITEYQVIDGSAIVDREFNIIMADEQVFRFIGVGLSMYTSIVDIIHPVDLDDFIDVSNSLHSSEYKKMVLRMRRCDNAYRWVLLEIMRCRKERENSLLVTPIAGPPAAPLRLDCRESGSTLRFLIPIASLTGQAVSFTGRGRLMERPQSVYEALYREQGLRFEQSAAGLTVEGALTPGEYRLAGNVSSQFISGLLFALPLLSGNSTLHLIPPVESRSYIDMTRSVQAAFGVQSHWLGENTLAIPGGQHYHPCDYTVEGDYSQAAFPAVLGAACGGVTIIGLAPETLQGDAAILDILRRCGAVFTRTAEGISFEKAPLHGVDIDLADCPDLGPVLMVLGLLCEGTTVIRNAERLRLKESDRIAAMEAELRAVGGLVESEGGTITVQGCADRLHAPAGVLHGHNDHRVVMSLAVLALSTGIPLTVDDAEAITKSWPNFFEAIKPLGAEVEYA